APTLSQAAVRIDQSSNIRADSAPENAIPVDCDRITPAMLPLVALTQEEVDHVVSTVPGGAPNVQDIYPLAALQEGMLFHHLKEGRNDPYVLSRLFAFANRTRFEDFVAALRAVIDRHDVLRTAVVSSGVSQPVQVVYRKATVVVEEFDDAHGSNAQQRIEEE